MRKTSRPIKPEGKPPANPLRSALMVTGGFFIVVLFGLCHHEMWRDEHQAWLVARDAHSLPQLFENLRYEGNPALWHILLYILTAFTSNPVAMQALHLLIASAFIFVFYRYAPFASPIKVLFSFGYFTLYEYSVISRSYGLGLLLVFIVCTLYRHRTSNYALIGIVLALLANVSIYGVMLSLGLAGLLLLDYFCSRGQAAKPASKAVPALAIYLAGLVASLYQIWPSKDNSFPVPWADHFFNLQRWALAASRLFTTYLYIPDYHGMRFWNTNVFFDDSVFFQAPFWRWLGTHPGSFGGAVCMPLVVFLIGLLVFMRRPLLLLLYSGVTAGLISFSYCTYLLHSRYCGHLLVLLVACYWLAESYPEKAYSHPVLRSLSGAGKRIGTPFLVLILVANLLGAGVAYAKDYRFKFSPSKEVADYIRANKLDTLKIAGGTDFILSPIASYLNTRIFYEEVNEFGSFCVWNGKRDSNLIQRDQASFIINVAKQGDSRFLLICSTPINVLLSDRTERAIEHGVLEQDIQIDLLKTFDAGIVESEMYYLYLVRRDPSGAGDLLQHSLPN